MGGFQKNVRSVKNRDTRHRVAKLMRVVLGYQETLQLGRPARGGAFMSLGSLARKRRVKSPRKKHGFIMSKNQRKRERKRHAALSQQGGGQEILANGENKGKIKAYLSLLLAYVVFCYGCLLLVRSCSC